MFLYCWWLMCSQRPVYDSWLVSTCVVTWRGRNWWILTNLQTNKGKRVTKIAGRVNRRPLRTFLLISLSPCSPRRRGLRSGSLRHGQRRLDTPGWARMRRRKTPPVLLPSRKRQKMGWRLVSEHLQSTRGPNTLMWCCPNNDKKTKLQ